MKADKSPEEYPIHFIDSIDEYLWKEHHILAGCCSAIGILKYDVAREVAEKLSNVLIEKACEYMRNHIDPQLTIYHEQTWKKRDEFIRNFKRYMIGK